MSMVSFAYSQEIYRDTIPFRDDLGIIIIPIEFNGKERQFAFDTGASNTLGFSWVKEELKPTSKTKVIRSSSGSRTKMRLYKSGKIGLGSRKISKHRILGNRDSEIYTCYAIDGILGTDIISLFNWTINFEEKYLVMHPADIFPEDVPQMKAMDFSYSNGVPNIYFTINTIRIKFLFDTGATSSDLDRRKVSIKDTTKLIARELYTAFYNFNGVRTSKRSILYQFKEVTSKDVLLYPILDYNDKTTTKVGNSLWNKKTLFMSLKYKKLFCNSETIDEKSFSYDCSLTLEEGKMVVSKILIGSEAWEKGLRQGTEIRAINGRVKNDFCGLVQLQTEIMKQKGTLQLELMNGEIIKMKRKPIFQ